MTTRTLHASSVAVDGKGLLILGPSGSGKSALALRLMALGAVLIADDRTVLDLSPQGVVLRCPPNLSGLIEARGIGILHAPALAEARLDLVVDLGTPEPDRLPPRRSIVLLGRSHDLVYASPGDHFPAAVLYYLRHGRQA